MNTDFIIYTIVKRASAFINLNWVDQPFMIYPDVYKKNKQALASAMKHIIENEIILGVEIVAFDSKGMELNLRNASLSEYGNELARKRPIEIRLKGLVNKVTSTYNSIQDELYNKSEKYEGYSDERLIKMVKSNSFPSSTDRSIVVKILKDRGY